MFGARLEQVALGPNCGADGCDYFFANCIQWRIGHLSKQLLEIIEQQTRPSRQHCYRCIGAHRADWFGPTLRHRRENDLEFLVGIAKNLLPAQDAVAAEHHVLSGWQIAKLDQPSFEPLLVWKRRGQFLLDLFVGHDSLLCCVDEQHFSGLQTTLAHDIGLINVDNTNLAGHDQDVVFRHPVSAWAQTVSVEHCTNQRAVGKRNTSRAIPWLHQRGVEAIERTLLRIHLLMIFPSLRDHHQHCVWQ